MNFFKGYIIIAIAAYDFRGRFIPLLFAAKGADFLTFYIYTFGCKVNQYESDCLSELMVSHGFEMSLSADLADIVIINSCTVTQSADIKLGQLLRRIKRINPEAVTAVCGCYPQAHKNPELISAANIIAGEGNKTELVKLISGFIENKKRTVCIPPHEKGEAIENMSLNRRNGKTRAIIKIQDGCDRFCSYCIIPFARGRSRSKPLDEIEKEAKALVKSGHKELVLVGINLSCYGEEFGCDIADAVYAASLSGADRIRLGSIEPEMLTDVIITRLSKVKNLCPHFHLSLQSGCDKTLFEMRRKYTSADYYALVSKLRECFDGCAVTTDVMTGFPGETEEDFLQSLDFVKKIGFTKVHVFPYSEREGTRAAERSDQVPKSVRQSRAAIMSQAAGESEEKYLLSLVGKTEEILFEREKDLLWHQGHTKSYVLVKVPRKPGECLWKELRQVKIAAVKDGYCIGELI